MKRILASIATLALLAAVPSFAMAAGSEGSGSQDCGAGKVYDKTTKKCVTQKSDAVDDDSFYEAGRMLALGGRYEEAIKMLSFVRNKSDPRVLNYLGYSHRKAGRVLVGLGYYQEALRIDPNQTLVREYLGEAHLTMGNVAAAREQLDEIARRKGTDCAEYAELSRQIDAYVKKG